MSNKKTIPEVTAASTIAAFQKVANKKPLEKCLKELTGKDDEK